MYALFSLQLIGRWCFFFSSRRRHTRLQGDWSSDVCSSDLRGRLAILLTTLRQALPRRRVRLLELGCGSGNVLAALGEFGEAVGMEVHPDLATAARAAGLHLRPGAPPPDPPVPPGRADGVPLPPAIRRGPGHP